MPVLLVTPILTGAHGFVGRVMAERLGATQALSMAGDDWEAAVPALSWEGATVYHLAARAHGSGASEETYRRDNAEKTRALAEQAAALGARALVFLSSIKVHGEETRGKPFAPDDVPHPQDAYARSKLMAEQALADIARRSGMRVAIVRSPLVYGPRPKGNLAALLRLADSPWPLPFAALDARRSFVHVRDLCEALLACGEADARGIYLAAHPQPVTPAQLMASLRRAYGRPERLFAVPPAFIEAMAALVGARERARRLTRPLVADPSRLQRELGWSARVDAEAAAREMAAS